MQIGFIIIGDEILPESRQDSHFKFFKNLLQHKGLQLSWRQRLSEDRTTLIRQWQHRFSQNKVVFVRGSLVKPHRKSYVSGSRGSPEFTVGFLS